MRITPDTPGCDGCNGCGCGQRPARAPAAAPALEEHAWLDRLFLHPRWGFAGSLLVFALVLFMVFQVSASIDAATTARLAEAAAQWQPASTPEVLAKAVADGLIGLAAIVVPYMVPLMLLLVALEQAGIMPRMALVIDRAFHRIGLHGGVAVPFLAGLGCNVPAITGAARLAAGRERLTASVLITLVPCSARSAIILAIAGKWLGAWGVIAIFGSVVVVIATLGRLLSKPRDEFNPFKPHAIPPYAVPRPRELLAETWARSRDVLTIVLPLLVAGSIVLALLGHYGADRVVNAALTPVTVWWLGLPAVLGVPLLFGILRKELSLLMIFQALGTLEVGAVMDATQLVTLLLFLAFYVPCLSTFAVMVRTLGARGALQSVALSIAVALAASGAARGVMEAAAYLAGV